MSKLFPFVVVAILARYETTKRNMRKEFMCIVHDPTIDMRALYIVPISHSTFIIFHSDVGRRTIIIMFNIFYIDQK